MKQILFAAAAVAICISIAVRFSPEADASFAEMPQAFENYDIRLDRSADALAKIAEYRTAVLGADAPAHDPSRYEGASREIDLELGPRLNVPEVIAPKRTGDTLVAEGGSRRLKLLNFITRNPLLFGDADLSQLVTTADYTNPDGVLSFVHLEQRIGGVPVFQGEIKAGFTKSGGMFRIINNFAPGIIANRLSSNFGSPETAVARAAETIGMEIDPAGLKRINEHPNTVVFDRGALPDTISAEKFYFPIEPGVARPAWRVLLWTPGDAFYVIVDAENGSLLWRKNLTEKQTASATYNVYGNTTSLLKLADSPAPFTPGPSGPAGTQAPLIPRADFTLIGNEAPYTFNNLGWIPDGGLDVRTPANPNITDGNNVEAGIDRDGVQGVDNNGWAFGEPARVFSYAYNPSPGNPGPGEDPVPPSPQPYPPSAFQQGVIAHAFYTANRWHDEMYRFGFTEAARNFQHFNFGRGGSEGDRISFEVQDSLGTNGANFSIPADGAGRPRLQMTVWTGSTPDRDGALDAQVVVHELTHGVTNRLHGNTSGIASNMARGMGEGWSDFAAAALLSEPSDDQLGIHALAGYVTLEILPGHVNNYYYGIRRFPLAVKRSVGPNGLPHNPLTFRYINAGCNTLIGTTDNGPNSAYPRGPIGTQTCDQIHNLGEVWAVALWEVRGQLILRHGGAEGNRRVLQYMTDGMKLSPLNPTVVQSRDAIITAASVSDPGDVRYVWRGFAIRGMGALAAVQNTGSGNNNTVVTESVAVPEQFRRPAPADFDGDGRSDISVYRPNEGVWYLNRSTDGFAGAAWGISTDTPAAADYDGDGRSDLAVFRATAEDGAPDFYILRSSDLTVSYISWGLPGDVAAVDDFDGDGKADAAVFRPSSAMFWVLQSSNGAVLNSRPQAGTRPATGDFDGDGKADFVTFAGGNWLISRSSDNHMTGFVHQWGLDSDKLVPADYDGDGVDDLAVFRPSDGVWYINRSTGGISFVQFGSSTDIPVPGDYDGDGRADQAVYRGGEWYLNRSTDGFAGTVFGLAGDVPLPAVRLQ